jgi:hypothetical protein
VLERDEHQEIVVGVDNDGRIVQLARPQVPLGLSHVRDTVETAGDLVYRAALLT